ncbi:MAG: hypothetical protein K8H89_08025 [Flavobacteriales bacterium]|jgi:hypothetical protein|nr:hypothetical protein [Flavobacteriales bacterium]
MRELIHNLSSSLAEFEAWFDQRFGWFFTNGMKDRASESRVREARSQEPTVPTT